MRIWVKQMCSLLRTCVGVDILGGESRGRLIELPGAKGGSLLAHSRAAGLHHLESVYGGAEGGKRERVTGREEKEGEQERR